MPMLKQAFLITYCDYHRVSRITWEAQHSYIHFALWFHLFLKSGVSPRESEMFSFTHLDFGACLNITYHHYLRIPDVKIDLRALHCEPVGLVFGPNLQPFRKKVVVWRPASMISKLNEFCPFFHRKMHTFPKPRKLRYLVYIGSFSTILLPKVLPCKTPSYWRG